MGVISGKRMGNKLNHLYCSQTSDDIWFINMGIEKGGAKAGANRNEDAEVDFGDLVV